MLRPSCLILTLLLATTSSANVTAELNQVGNATLKVMFWTIYDSYLFSKDGVYRGVEPELALRIDYRRNIKQDDLIDRTRKEWRKQGVYVDSSETWLQQLDTFWPDIKRGDQIVLRVNAELASEFFFNGELIGSVVDPMFTRRFLSIWLSEKSSYPHLRNQLVGLS
jgi:hypothetical protein